MRVGEKGKSWGKWDILIGKGKKKIALLALRNITFLIGSHPCWLTLIMRMLQKRRFYCGLPVPATLIKTGMVRIWEEVVVA
jgi:hypothetical protein